MKAQVACGPGASAAGRALVVEDPSGLELGRVTLGAGSTVEASVPLRADAAPSRARLLGGDAIASDDAAPVLRESGRGALAVVADTAEEAVATGGAPVVEQALSALKLEVEASTPSRPSPIGRRTSPRTSASSPTTRPASRPSSGAPWARSWKGEASRSSRSARTPRRRRLALPSSRSSRAPPAWRRDGGARRRPLHGDVARSPSPRRSLADLAAPRRAVLTPEDARSFEPLIAWGDGAPLVARRALGRGEAWIVTLPFSVDASDLPLRPAFLALLDAWAREALARAAPRAAARWASGGPSPGRCDRRGDRGRRAARLEVSDDELHPAPVVVLGTYRLTVDGKPEARTVAPALRELDLRPRAAAPARRRVPPRETRRTAVDASGARRPAAPRRRRRRDGPREMALRDARDPRRA